MASKQPKRNTSPSKVSPTQTELLQQVVTKLDTIITQLDPVINYKLPEEIEDIEQINIPTDVEQFKKEIPGFLAPTVPDFEIVDDTNPTNDYPILFGKLK